jgi:hypothetical protein
VPGVVRGITASLFAEQAGRLLPELRRFAEPEIDPGGAAELASPSAVSAKCQPV